MKLDVDHARSYFPGLDSKWAFFDNAGGSLAPRQVIDRIHTYLTRYQVQLGASYETSARASELVLNGRRAMAELIGADADEVVLGSSTTMNVYVLAAALRPQMQPGDEVVVTDIDHEANNGAWRRLAASGIVVREWKMNRDTALLETDELDSILSNRTRLVCFTHCSNLVGAFHDVAAITRKVHEVGASVFVDGVAYAPHRALDVVELDVDYYATSLYKIFGPHLAVLYGKRDRLLEARNQNHDFVGEESIPSKLMPGNVAHELAAGLPGIVDYVDALHERAFPRATSPRRSRLAQVFDLFAEHEQSLGEQFLEFILSKRSIRLLGPPTASKNVRAPIFSFVVEGRKASDVVARVDANDVAIRWGDFYAKRAIDAWGLGERDGVVRVSMLHYNTKDEVARLVRALDAAT